MNKMLMLERSRRVQAALLAALLAALATGAGVAGVLWLVGWMVA